MKFLTGRDLKHFLPLAVIVALYFLLVLPMIPHIGISFDEQVDLSIAQSYDASPLGWLRGIDLDSMNVRLPMYVSWIFLGLLDSEIFSTRLVACLLGALTLVAVFLYCDRRHDRNTGVLACAILATSPYFLAFSKVGMTEGDIYITCFTAWLLLSIAWLSEKPTLLRITTVGLCLGLALSSKASAASLVMATVIALLLPGVHAADGRQVNRRAVPMLSVTNILLLLTIMTLVLVVIVAGWLAPGFTTIKQLPKVYAGLSDQAIVLHYVLAVLPWLVALGLIWRNRQREVAGLGRLLLVLAMAALTFLLIPPVHTTNPAILATLIDAFLSSTHSFTWQFAGEAAALHFLAILLKPGIVVGCAMWLSLAAAVWQSWRRPILRLPLLFFCCYFSFLVLKLPHAQTYFMMPLLPILAILLADRVIRLYRRVPVAAWIFIGCVVLSVALDLWRTYPHTHLNGYQWLGARYLAGRSTIGYRGVAQTPSDGVEQISRWARDNIAPGERVVCYLWADHIRHAQLHGSGIIMRNGLRPDVTLDHGNYALIHINATLDEGRGPNNPEGSVFKYHYDQDKLRKEFRKVYSVKRPFGIEVASVWYRKIPYDINPQGDIVGFKSAEVGSAPHPTVD